MRRLALVLLALLLTLPLASAGTRVAVYCESASLDPYPDPDPSSCGGNVSGKSDSCDFIVVCFQADEQLLVGVYVPGDDPDCPAPDDCYGAGYALGEACGVLARYEIERPNPDSHIGGQIEASPVLREVFARCPTA